MATQSWYDPNFDVGQPAFTRFWGEFVGTRSKINQDIMKERLSSSDPGELGRLERNINDNITRLQESISKLTREGQISERSFAKMSSDTNKEFIRAMSNIAAASIAGESRVRAAEVGAVSAQLLATAEINAEEISGFTEFADEFSSEANGLMSTSAASGEVSQRMREQYTKNDAQHDPVKLLAMSKAAMDAAGGDREKMVGVWESIPADIREGYSFGSFGDLITDKVKTRTVENTQQAIEEVKKGGISDDTAKRFPPELREGLKGIRPDGGGGSLDESGSKAPGPDAKAQIDSIRATIKSLEDRQKKIINMQDKALDSNKSAYSDFYGNALTETLFRVPEKSNRSALEAFKQLNEKDKSLLDQLLTESGGDVVKAREILESRRKEPKAKPPETAPTVETRQTNEIGANEDSDIVENIDEVETPRIVKAEPSDGDVLSESFQGEPDSEAGVNKLDLPATVLHVQGEPKTDISELRPTASASSRRVAESERLKNMPGSPWLPDSWTDETMKRWAAEARRSNLIAPGFGRLADLHETGETTDELQDVMANIDSVIAAGKK